MFRLLASMVADASLTVLTCGGWIGMCHDVNGGSFTGNEMQYQREKETIKQVVNALEQINFTKSNSN